MKLVENNIYPQFTVTPPQSPNRLYAVPLFGLLIKGLLLIPAAIFFILVSLAVLVVNLINPFFVLFAGKYWQTAYQLNLGIIRYFAKYNLYLYGVSDKYPGFNLQANDRFSLEMPYPQNPNRLFAIPIFGLLARMILLIPFFLFAYVFAYATNLGVFLMAWASVLFTGKYPEVFFEMVRDINRLNFSAHFYMYGLSDKYPSFEVSWNHKVFKIILLIISALLLIWSFMANPGGSNYQSYPAKNTPSSL